MLPFVRLRSSVSNMVALTEFFFSDIDLNLSIKSTYLSMHVFTLYFSFFSRTSIKHRMWKSGNQEIKGERKQDNIR